MRGASAAQGARRGFGPWRLLLPLLLALGTVAAVLETGRFDAELERMHAQLEAVQGAAATLRIAREQARFGDVAGFEALDAARAVIPELVAMLAPPGDHSASRLPPPDTRGVRAALERVARRAERVSALAPEVLALSRDAERLQSVATGLLVSSDELVELLIAKEAKPSQLRAAARQLMLVQRISTNLRRMLEPGAGLLAAADRLGRDAVVFGEVATALLNGNRELGITRVRSDEGRELLVSIGRDFRVMAQSVEAVVGGAAARAALVTQGERLVAAQRVLDGELAQLAGAIRVHAAQRLVTPRQVAQLATLTAIALLAALVLALVERRLLGREQRAAAAREADQAQALEAARERLAREVEELASDIHRIADGDIGLRAHTASDGSAPLGVARAGLDRIRRQLRERVEDGVRLARSGQLVGDVAGRLRELSRRHALQAEEAGQVTRIMAAALESLRSESARVSDAARQSGVSAQAAGHALTETLHELDAAQSGIEQCAERVRALEEVTRELRAVRTLVEDVGELGKMLSLNVAIQASVDSAASRSLAAFSDEVQRLATRARSAVTQVEAIHDELRGEAERAASAVKEGVWRARSAAERGRGARQRVEELSGVSRQLEELNHTLGRAQRDHAVNVTDVVRAITSLHALTREVREQVDATADSATAFGDAAAAVEHRLSAPPGAATPVIEMAGSPEPQQGEDGTDSTADGQERPATGALKRALQRWS